MARYVSVKNGTVTLAGIAWDGVTNYSSPDGGTLVQSDVANVGDTYNGSTFTPGAPLAPVVPVSVSAAQFRLALSQQNLLTTVTTAVAAASQEIQTYWQFEDVFGRQNPLLLQMAATLNMTSAQIDAVFILAATFAP